MSRRWMPFYIGDYLQDTGHLTTLQHGAYMLLIMHCWQKERLPDSAAERAAIARLTPAKWEAIGGPVEAFFQADGTHKRVQKEIERSERVSLQRKISGAKGGFHSSVERAKRSGKIQANGSAKFKLQDTQSQSKSISSSSVEHCTLGVPSGPMAEPSKKNGRLSEPASGPAPSQVGRAELETIYEKKRGVG